MLIFIYFSQNQQDVKNKKLMDCTDRINNDKSMFDFNNISSISSGSDFVFKPVINLFKSPGNLKKCIQCLLFFFFYF